MSEKSGKLRDIKETASDAVEIMHELGTPGVQETLDKVREIAIIAKEIMEEMKTPEWQQNIDNFRLISQNFNEASERVERSASAIRETGVVDDAKELITTVKSKIDAFAGSEGGAGVGGQELKELANSFKDMLNAIKELVNELKVTVSESKESGTVHHVEETKREVSNIYRAVKDGAER